MRWELLTVLFLCVRLSSQLDPLMEHCYQKDVVPVDLDLVFDSNCEDNQGNIYQPNSTLQSCCDCFSYKCSQRTSWDLRVKVGWVRSVSSLCCQTCNGTVVPANTFISSSSLATTFSTLFKKPTNISSQTCLVGACENSLLLFPY